MQTPEKENKEIENVEREEWNARELADQSPYLMTDEVQRQMLRGDETKGSPDDRDVVGSVDSNETPHGRKETKDDAA